MTFLFSRFFKATKPVHSQVAEGFRRPLPAQWPPALAELVTECMAQEPNDRPSAAQVPCPAMHMMLTCRHYRDLISRPIGDLKRPRGNSSPVTPWELINQ